MSDVMQTWRVGSALRTLKKVMMLDTMKSELMAGNNPIHFDDEFARSAGLPAAIATGMISCGYLSQLLTETFGVHWVQGGRASFAFVKPVYAGDELTCHAVVRECADDGTAMRLSLELWCENQHGEKVTIGTASLTVPRES